MATDDTDTGKLIAAHHQDRVREAVGRFLERPGPPGFERVGEILVRLELPSISTSTGAVA